MFKIAPNAPRHNICKVMFLKEDLLPPYVDEYKSFSVQSKSSVCSILVLRGIPEGVFLSCQLPSVRIKVCYWY